jgi:hypothetical protein
VIPTSKERSEILLYFYNTYIYLLVCKTFLAFGCGSPTPLISISSITVTFSTNNNAIVYSLEQIISYARLYWFIFVEQSVWWLPSIIGLQEDLVIHIDNLQVRPESTKHQAELSQNHDRVHPDWIPQIEWTTTCREDQNSGISQEDINRESEFSSTSEDSLPNKVFNNCEHFLSQAEFNRNMIARQNLEQSKNLSRKSV